MASQGWSWTAGQGARECPQRRAGKAAAHQGGWVLPTPGPCPPEEGGQGRGAPRQMSPPDPGAVPPGGCCPGGAGAKVSALPANPPSPGPQHQNQCRDP